MPNHLINETSPYLRQHAHNLVDWYPWGLNPDGRESPEIAKLAEFTKNQSSIGGKATAYVCLNYNCKLPTTDIGKMLELLNVR